MVDGTCGANREASRSKREAPICGNKRAAQWAAHSTGGDVAYTAVPHWRPCFGVTQSCQRATYQAAAQVIEKLRSPCHGNGRLGEWAGNGSPLRTRPWRRCAADSA